MHVTRRSMTTGKVHTIDLPITPAQMEAYSGGALIQRAFPHLTADQREFVLTGTTAEEWAALFPPEPEDDEPEDAPAF